MNKPTDRSIYRFINSNIYESGKLLSNLYIDDPTVMGFNFIVDTNDYYSPLFTENNEVESAIRYLNNVNEKGRAIMLKEFKFRLRDLIVNFPYYFQSISGLNEFYKYNPKETWRNKERRLTIKTLESMDLRVGNMIDKYMKASFDERYMREMIPINLRKFNAYIVLSEIRNFKTFYQQVVQDPVDGRKIEVLNNYLNSYVIKLEGCRFDFSNSNPWMETIDNARPDKPIENEFSLVFDRISERHKMNFIQTIAGSLSFDDQDKLTNESEPDRRRTGWGVPSSYEKPGERFIYNEQKGEVPTIGDIKTFEKKNGGILDSIKGFIVQQPEVQTMIKNFDPTVILGRIENLALDQVRAVVGQAVLGNVFDLRNQEFRTDLINLALERLRGAPIRNQPATDYQETAKRTEYDNTVAYVPHPGRTPSSSAQIGAFSSPGHLINPRDIGRLAAGGRTAMNGNQIGSFGNPGHNQNPANIGNFPPTGHTTYNNQPEQLSVYTAGLHDLGMEVVPVDGKSDYFRAYLGNVFGVEQKPFSNLLSTLVGGVIPDLIKQSK